jgi:hypothetical protein
MAEENPTSSGTRGDAIQTDSNAKDQGVTQTAASTRPKNAPHGQYYLAPDSAEPIPDSLWQRLDLKILDQAIKATNERQLAYLSEEERSKPNLMTPSMFFVSPEEAETLLKLGGSEVQDLLDDFSAEDRASGF